MNTNRRDFLRMGAIAGATAVLAKSANARTGGTRSCASAALPVPDGPEFAGMSGAYSALVTPYKPDGSVNEEMIEKTIEFGLANGLTGFHLTSSAGEGFLLSADERKTVYDRAAWTAVGQPLPDGQQPILPYQVFGRGPRSEHRQFRHVYRQLLYTPLQGLDAGRAGFILNLVHKYKMTNDKSYGQE